MPARHFCVVVVILLACLFAVPACKKDGPPGPGLDLPADEELIRQSRANLKQIGLAWHAYHDTRRLNSPRGIYGPDGKTLGLSWRVAILPNLGEEALYKQFKLNEAWDSEHNKKLIPKMPKIYAPPGVEDTNGHTYYCAFEGKDALMQPVPPPPPPGVGKWKDDSAPPPRPPGVPGQHVRRPSFAEMVADGTSYTLMVVEAGEPVVWTKPQDIPFDKDKPLPPLGGVFRKVTNFVLCDGSLNYIPRDTPEALIKAIIMPSDGGEGDREFFKNQEAPPRGNRPDRTPPSP